MKKVSTVAAKASKKISQQKLTVGLDLGDRNHWYCVLDESGNVLLEQRPQPRAGKARPHDHASSLAIFPAAPSLG